MSFSAVPLITKKRDGHPLSGEDIEALIAGYTKGVVPDYQMSAFAMATCLRGMTVAETTALTRAMRDSGKVIAWPKGQKRIDKHSTGGVGDKISLCLAPLVACCGVQVPMMSGRGLGHTGGTLDKLEAIPGFRVDLSIAKFRSTVKRHGFAMIGQTKDVAPADRKLYALRDVTGTVESIPLITASILSKKLAEGIHGLVLDCKTGSGAFMRKRRDAEQLATTIAEVGRSLGLKVRALLTDMDVPLGFAIGNALETIEAIEVLHGRGPDDVRELTLSLGRHMLELAGVSRGRSAERKLETALSDGSAAKCLAKVIRAQGGDPKVVDDYSRFACAKQTIEVPAPGSGFVRAIDAKALGLASMDLGAGRRIATDPVDAAAGMVLHRKVGDPVKKGEALATLHTNLPARARAAKASVSQAFTIGRTRPGPRRGPVLKEVSSR